MTAMLAHIIVLSGFWDAHQPSRWACAVCGREWETLPDYADSERFTCPGKGTP